MTASENRQGRWLTPDPLGGEITNPQSLNRYAYALNNPTSFTDPLGLQANPCGYDSGGAPIYCTTSTASSGGTTYNTFEWDFLNSPGSYYSNTGHGGGGGAVYTIQVTSTGFASRPGANIVSWPQLQQLVHQNNESNLCDEVVDCIVFKESSAPGGFNANALGRPFTPPEGGGTQQAKGLMQITQNTAATDNNNYPHAPSGAALYNALSNPALNIFVGSEYLQIVLDEYGDVRNALNRYGGTVGTGSYANAVLNCVQELQLGNLSLAEQAAHGH